MNLLHEHFLRCQVCNKAHDPRTGLWMCPCGGLLDVEIEAAFPLQRLARRPPGLWRYREALPVPSAVAPVSLGEPLTPLAEAFKTPCRMLLKLDYLFPTGSFKDRGASVLVTQARELGITHLVEDSSGNAGAAIAAYAAAAGIQAKILVPDGASTTKTAVIAAYGAELVRVPGTRAETADAAWRESQHAYYASHVWNPYFLEGTKTIAFEIWEQLNGAAPDWVIAPVGHGTMVLGLAHGFGQLLQSGLIEKLPRIVGVQATRCAPLVQAYHDHSQGLQPVIAGPTEADGIAIGHPIRWRQILAAIRKSDGLMTEVSEAAIRSALRHWAGRGWLMEPTSATALAAFDDLAAAGAFVAQDTVIIPVTGSGAKLASRNFGAGT